MNCGAVPDVDHPGIIIRLAYKVWSATNSNASLSALLKLTHFRLGLRLVVGDAGAPTVDLPREEDRFLPLASLVGLSSLAVVTSRAILPPSFSHRSSIFFFSRFLAIGSGIAVSSLLFPISIYVAQFVFIFRM